MNPVVFSVDPSSASGVCSVTGTDGTTLDYIVPGTCVIDANQDGNASYAAAPTVMATITVDQEPSFTLDSPPTTATVGHSYAYTFAASGAPAPTYALGPGAPTWLTINATTGAPVGYATHRDDLVHLLGGGHQRRRGPHRRPVCGDG